MAMERERERGKQKKEGLEFCLFLTMIFFRLDWMNFAGLNGSDLLLKIALCSASNFFQVKPKPKIANANKMSNENGSTML